ncbi:BA75_00032T0 [Komagataella pastoris]|uniref:non-specific serine/threonine protein kinase n=1 Tax=Komagataella pastoris TaxID=4922 RepID=A0A1B2J7G3_PICPA|nr:BA75_00032T0 [Komagataella pastoris]
MGAELSLLAPTAQPIALSAYVDFLSNIQYNKPLGTSRFLKTVKGLNDQGSIVVKVLVKPNSGLDLSEWVAKLESLRLKLLDVPNVIPYNLVIDSVRAGYLIRPFQQRTLYERVSIQPYLEPIEKKWIAFQLIHAVMECHERGQYHGDIKSENVLLTSWDMVFLTDFAPFKPIYLPGNNPSQFSFYFDTSRRNVCYVAPERFLGEGTPTQFQEGDKLTSSMDIFSLGCTVAELFLEGSVLFTLPQLFKYKKGEYTPTLSGIVDNDLRNMIQEMIDLDPKKRISARDCLKKHKGKVFPEYFYSFLYDYMLELSTPCDHSVGNWRFEECDRRIERIYNDMGMICDKLSVNLDLNIVHSFTEEPSQNVIPMTLRLPGVEPHIPQSSKTPYDSALIILNILLHSMRNTTHSSYRIKSCDLILMISEMLSDEQKLDRCLPYLVHLLNDPSIDVQAAALKYMTQLLLLVDSLTPVNVLIFPEYILPKLSSFLSTTKGSYMRMIFATILPHLAKTALKFYEMAILLGSHVEKFELLKNFENLTIQLLIDPDSSAKISLLKNILPLASVFGKDKTNDIILSHMITYLNDPDENLRVAFIESILGLSIFVGITSLENYILPLLVQTLTDSSEIVVVNVLRSFAELNNLGLIKKRYKFDLIKVSSKLLLHPNSWIRLGTLRLLISVVKDLSLTDFYCLLYPLVRPFFEYEVTNFDWATLYPCIIKPIPRSIYTLSITWALKAEKTLFWQQVKLVKPDPFGSRNSTFLLNRNSKIGESGVVSNSQIPTSPEDFGWLGKLKASGFDEKDLWKIATLRDYIFRVARSKSSIPSQENNEVTMQQMGIYPRIVFFEKGSMYETEGFVSGSSMMANYRIFDNSEYSPESLTKRKAVGGVNSNHTYSGANPYILKFLECIKFRHVLDDSEEFGPHVPSVTAEEGDWKFEGILVSHLTEHTGSITSLALSPDQQYFLTGDSKGIIRLWDVLQLERNGYATSHITVSMSSSVKDIKFIENRNSFCAVTADGEIKIFRVEINGTSSSVRSNGSPHSYESMSLLREHSLKGDHVSDIKFIGPNLAVSTLSCRLILFDLRDMQIAGEIQNPVSHGFITSFDLDSSQSWLLMGTSKGILDFYDLRFELLVKSWKLKSTSFPIKRITVPPAGFTCNRKTERFALINGGTNDSVTIVFDVSKGQCSELYFTETVNLNTAIDNYEVLELDNGEERTRTSVLATDVEDRSITTLTMLGSNQFLTATFDKRVILWDTGNKANSSALISKLDDSTSSFSSVQVRPHLMAIHEKIVDKDSQNTGGPKRNMAGANSSTFDLHSDIINGIAVIQKPFKMIILVDRAGVINIYK